jgi:two-component system nitrogen regulation response regulator GlnG
LKKSAQTLKVEPKRLSAEALQVLTQLPFPGNVRQLENLCHWLTVMAPAQIVEAHDLPSELRQPEENSILPVPAPVSLHSTGATCPMASASVGSVDLGAGMSALEGSSSWTESLRLSVLRLLEQDQIDVMNGLCKEFESVLIRTALKYTHGRRIEAAQKLGIGRNTITRKIQELGLDAEQK